MPGIADLEAVDQRLDVEPGAVVAEVFDGHGLECRVVGYGPVRPGLNDPWVGDVVEASAELYSVCS